MLDSAFATNTGPVQNHNFVLGRMLEHARRLKDVLGCFQVDKAGSVASDVDTRLAGRYLDVPTMLSVFQCYVGLVRMNRVLLSVLLDSLPMLKDLPSITLFPGWSMGGFNVEGRVDLQARMFVSVTEDLMGGMEGKLGLREDEKGEAVKYAMQGSVEILKAMLEQEAKENPPLEVSRGVCPTLQEVVEKLKVACG
jgi:hypothetical protein